MTEPGEGRREWHVEPKMGGAAEIVEEGAGADGGPGYIAHVERHEDAVEIARWWNEKLAQHGPQERPRFVGGPLDGETIEERFPPGHMLHGKLPSGVRIPENAPPLPPGKMHEYEYVGGDYEYRGVADE